MNLFHLFVTILIFGVCHGANSVYSNKRINRIGYRNITRIIGGEIATDPIPYQVSLQQISYNQWQHFCGGSIIGKSHILTAAHCMTDLRPERISAVVGTSNLKNGGYRHKVKSYVVHELYYNKGGDTFNDVAIIKVATPFNFNQKTIAPISLAENFSQRMEKNYPVTLTGWGSTNPNSVSQQYLPDNLMILNYNTISNTDCRLRDFNVSPNEICTFVGRRRGACVGDSGGPLVNRERNIQIGIVSYGSRICASGKPDVYVRVSKYLSWIENAVILSSITP